MSPITSGGSFLLVLANEQATRRLAGDVAAMLAPGDLVTLSGDLGAGKTAFARAVIRRLAGDEGLEVPSPTFTLIQTYPLRRFPVVHADLYRVSDTAELDELGFEEAAEEAAVLLEWPDRAGDRLPADRLDIAFTLAPSLGLNARKAEITAHGAFVARFAREKTIRSFLDDAGFATVERHHLQGDASTRAYERLVLKDRRAVLMNAPRRPDGPPVRNGLPYSAIAHLAEDVSPFVALARGLRARGFSAPEIFAANLAAGLLILEDFGSDGVVAGDPPTPIEERYAVATDVLIALHGSELPAVLPIAPKVEYRLPTYDLHAFLIEVELMPDWYLPHQGVTLAGSARLEFSALWHQALDRTTSMPPTWVLRDFHSPNLLWLPERDGIARIGLLDFQDAQLGPLAYDVVSLLQDARVDVPEDVELNLLARYAKARHAADRNFKLAEFVELYATMGAQRATKLLGIFTRLDRRDHKPQYLRHLPRVWRYLRRSLSHPSLALLKAWYDRYVPPPQTANP
jgi:tRNA threonylcarbamoyl adenosine modification protein YjeE